MKTAGKLTSLAGIFVPGLGIVGDALTQIGEAVPEPEEEAEKATPLSDLKDDLVSSLSSIGKQIIVTIDDADRLEPPEVMEILRLVRAVADFPNVTYVLCYDERVIAKAISAATQLDDGQAYLEKILQVQISVPAPEPFQLRHWFRSELATIATPDTDDQRQRLTEVIDHEGGRRLDTPRAVVRALNGVRLFWPPLREQNADLSDLVWLQIIRSSSSKYYKWVEKYCSICAVISSGKASIHESEIRKDWDELKGIFLSDGIDMSRESFFIRDILPGITTWVNDTEEPKIYGDLQDSSVKLAVASRRLKSPDHSRMYFALAQSPDSPTENDFRRLWAAADSSASAVATLLMEWHAPGVVTGVSKAVIMLDRLGSAYMASFNETRSTHLLLAFANFLDDAARKMGLVEFYGPEIWNEAEALIPVALSRLEKKSRIRVIEKMFSGSSIGWLTSVFRRETFAHGRYGDRKRPPQDWWLTDEELDKAGEIMLGRYRGLTLDEVLESPQPLSLLFAWAQGGDADGPRQLIEAAIQDDASLLRVLRAITGRVMTSPGGERITLPRSNLAPFLDYAQALERVEHLAASEGPLAAEATLLKLAFEEGKRF